MRGAHVKYPINRIAQTFVSLLPIGMIPSVYAADSSPQTLTATSGYFYRWRTDEHIQEAKWPSEKMKSNTMNFVLDYSSGLLRDTVKADMAWIGALNFQADYRCSEVAFCSKHADAEQGRVNIWAHNDTSGVALSKAALTLQMKHESFQGSVRAGYDQFRGGVLATNWGFLFPGSYRGLQLDGSWDRLSLNYIWTDAYRTPWATEYGRFLAADGQIISALQSLGLRYQLTDQITAEVAAGQSTNWQKRYFAKVSWNSSIGDTPILSSFHYYDYRISGQDFAQQRDTYGKQSVFSLTADVPWGMKASLEYIATRASSWFNVPEFVPRMTAGYGNSQGRLDYWWNAVSDFNKDGERAINIGIQSMPLRTASATFSLSANGIYASHISGWSPDRQRTDHGGREGGYNLDVQMGFVDEFWRPLSASIHFTQLKSSGEGLDPSDSHSLFNRYGLYSTDDLKFMVIYSQSIRSS